MTDIWVASDHHFMHSNILRFTDNTGELIRGKVFKDIEEHDQQLIDRHNTLVKPQDHVYFLGDFAIKKRGVECAKWMNGHKRLVRGNHDIFRTAQYIDAGFEEIYGVRVFAEHNLILSHIPLHPDCLSGRAWKNIHGHLHQNIVRTADGEPDTRYQCVSLEHTNYKPILIMR